MERAEGTAKGARRGRLTPREAPFAAQSVRTHRRPLTERRPSVAGRGRRKVHQCASPHRRRKARKQCVPLERHGEARTQRQQRLHASAAIRRPAGDARRPQYRRWTCCGQQRPRGRGPQYSRRVPAGSQEQCSAAPPRPRRQAHQRRVHQLRPRHRGAGAGRASQQRPRASAETRCTAGTRGSTSERARRREPQPREARQGQSKPRPTSPPGRRPRRRERDGPQTARCQKRPRHLHSG